MLLSFSVQLSVSGRCMGIIMGKWNLLQTLTAPFYPCAVSQWRIAGSTLLRFPKLLSGKQMQTWISAQLRSHEKLWKEEKQYCQVPLCKTEVMWTDLREYSEAKNQQPQRLSVFLRRLRLRWLISVFVVVNVAQKIKAKKERKNCGREQKQRRDDFPYIQWVEHSSLSHS